MPVKAAQRESRSTDPASGSHAYIPQQPQDIRTTVTSTRNPAVRALDSEITELEKNLSGLDAQLDADYLSYFMGNMKATNPFIGQQNVRITLTDDDDAQMALLYMTTQLRRGVAEPLHTELMEHTLDKDCAGDLITDQLFLKLGLSILNRDYSHALDYDSKIAAQSMCISAYQMAVVDYYLFEALDKTLSFVPHEKARQKLVDSVLNGVLIIYDVVKSEYSSQFEFVRKYRDLVSNAYQERSVLYEFGIYLMDWSTGKVRATKFTPHTGKALGAYSGTEISPEYVQGVTTIYGYNIKEFQDQECFKEPVADPKPGSVSWDTFVEGMGDPLHLARGISPLAKAIALGLVDTAGMCDVAMESPAGDGSGVSCSFNNPAQLSVMVKCEYAGLNPLKPPLNPAMANPGSGGGNVGDKGLQFVMKTNASCGGSPISNVSPSPGLEPGPLPLPEPSEPEPKSEEGVENEAEPEQATPETTPAPTPTPTPAPTPATPPPATPSPSGPKPASGGSAEEQKDKKNMEGKMKQIAVNFLNNSHNSESKVQEAAQKRGVKLKGGSGKTTSKGGIPISFYTTGKAKQAADKAIKNAKFVWGLKGIIQKNGDYSYIDGDGNVLMSGHCTPGSGSCKPGTRLVHGVTRPEGDGDYIIYIDNDCVNGCYDGRTAYGVMEHEWAHVYLFEGGMKAGKHHQFMGEAGVHHRCSETSDSCSSSCSSQEVFVGQHVKCEKFWPQMEKPTICPSPVADCPPDIMGSKSGQSGSSGQGGQQATGGSPVPDFCLAVSGGDGVPSECEGGMGSGSSCQFGNAMPVNIFKMIPGFGYTDPPPWLDQAYINKKPQTTTPASQPIQTQFRAPATQTQQQRKMAPAENRAKTGPAGSRYQDYPLSPPADQRSGSPRQKR